MRGLRELNIDMENHGPGPGPRAAPPPSGWSGALSRTADRLEPTGDPRGVIYGTIVAGSVIAIASQHLESVERLGLDVFITLVVYWLAHAYCEVLWQRYAHGARLRHSEIRRALWHELGILKGGVAPLAVMLAFRVTGAEFETAVWSALWTCVVLLFMTGLIAGVRSGARGLELVLGASIGGMFGLVLVLFKAGLH
jgi:hypothetical protein